MTIFPSKLINGESYAVKSSGFKFNPFYRSGYITSALLPWSTITLLMSYPPILRVTTKASSCGCMVPTLSSSKKLNVSQTSNLAFFGVGLASSASDLAIDITLEGRKPVLPRAAKMTLMVLKGGLEGAFP